MKIDLLPSNFVGIGDLPRFLAFTSQFRPLLIERKEAQAGDIFFIKHRSHKRLISHMAMVLEADKIFHCSMTVKTAVIQSDHAFFSIYEQKINFVQTIRYIDRRNEKLKEEHKGAAFIAGS